MLIVVLAIGKELMYSSNNRLISLKLYYSNKRFRYGSRILRVFLDLNHPIGKDLEGISSNLDEFERTFIEPEIFEHGIKS